MEAGRFLHTDRVGRMAAEIASELGLEAETVELIREAAPLHDIGKYAVSDEILLKPGPLTAGERRRMQGHTEIGRNLLRRSSSPALQLAAVIAASHHEHWDGSGYPAGLSGEEIRPAGGESLSRHTHCLAVVRRDVPPQSQVP